jgi:hypothetical protein
MDLLPIESVYEILDYPEAIKLILWLLRKLLHVLEENLQELFVHLFLLLGRLTLDVEVEVD